jgi:hypothetical protein
MKEDLKFAARLLARSSVWTAVAVLSLALGIGANTLAFSLVDSVLLRPFPYNDTERLVLLWGSKSESVTRGITGPDLRDWTRTRWASISSWPAHFRRPHRTSAGFDRPPIAVPSRATDVRGCSFPPSGAHIYTAAAAVQAAVRAFATAARPTRQ